MQLRWKNFTESSFLVSFGGILLLIYSGWIYWAFKNNFNHFVEWRDANENLHIEWPPRHAESNTSSQSKTERRGANDLAFRNNP